jgi:hypothetical protein
LRRSCWITTGRFVIIVLWNGWRRLLNWQILILIGLNWRPNSTSSFLYSKIKFKK